MFAILRDFKHIKRLLTKWKRNEILAIVKNLNVLVLAATGSWSVTE